jgi:hypothetical protein
MNWKECGRKRHLLNATYYIGIGLEGSKKATDNLSGYALSGMRVESWKTSIKRRSSDYCVATYGELTDPLKGTG